MKARQVIMYNKHLLRWVAVLTGRCLTPLWREVIKATGAKELFAMNDILVFPRSVVQTIDFVDGSSERQDVIRYVGGWGICVIDQQGIVRKQTAGPLPVSEPRQTNNAAELYAWNRQSWRLTSFND